MFESPAINPVIQEKSPSTRTKSTLNLQNILAGKPDPLEAKPKPEYPEEIIKRELTLSEVQEAWKQFAELRRGQVAEYNLLLRDFVLEGHTIKLQLTNPVEEPLLAGIKTDLVSFLKNRLRSEVALEGVLLKTSTKKIIYTNKEKFDHLAEKNPALLELKERLGLDTDY